MPPGDESSGSKMSLPDLQPELLQELYTEARKGALNIENAIDDILKEL